MLFELAHDIRNRRLLLTDGHVNAFNARALLVDDGVNGNRGLAGLPVANDQFALSTAYRDHGVDGFQTRLQRLIDRLSRDNTRCNLLDG